MPTKSKPKAPKGGLNKKQLAHLEKRLLEERQRVMKELGHYGESFNSSLQASDGDLSRWASCFLFRPPLGAFGLDFVGIIGFRPFVRRDAVAR